MKIRNMEIGDYQQVYSLWINTPGMGLNNRDDSREGISKYLLRNPNTCFVAEENNEIIGVILAGHDGRRGYIHHMAIEKGRQRHGIGSALVKTALDALKLEGIHKAALVVFQQNEQGNLFWEKQGFTMRHDLVYRNREITELPTCVGDV